MAYILQTRKVGALGATMAVGATSCTLATNTFGTPSGKQIITLDYNVAAKAADFLCTITGTAITSMTLLNGPDVEHTENAAVAMCFVDEHYADLIPFLGYANSTADQTTITSEVDLTSLSVTVTVPDSARRVKITGVATFSNPTANAQTVLRIKESATLLGYTSILHPNSSFITATAIAYVAAPTAGSHTYKLTAESSATSKKESLNVFSYILVEYI